jgi:hypothetical protein
VYNKKHENNKLISCQLCQLGRVASVDGLRKSKRCATRTQQQKEIRLVLNYEEITRMPSGVSRLQS